ncbi:NAD(P)/FAD-dependent oxidoreductase [Streptomyces plumbiresistens]|uniref:FAD-dependent oxidoreductase n=1 Tax=Streptomyces plumbiresistens TaxID=511811 RepID=A0ABP7SM51_9ACTN
MQTPPPSEEASDIRTGGTGHRVVIVGAGLAALRTAEELRRAEYTGAITLVGREEHLPYDRPPLSKEVIRGERDNTTLKSLEFFQENRIELRLGVAADGVDTARRQVQLADGSTVPYDDLIVATGLVPRRLNGLPQLRGVHVLRTLDDALALRLDLARSKRALVVGAGFIGCELAASIRSCGVEAVLIDVQPTPLAEVLGEEVGRLLERLHVAEGVDVRCGVGLQSLTGDERVTGAVLTDGTQVEADVVVLGVGSLPVTDWLEGSGLQLADRSAGGGVLADECGRTNIPHVWATGDVAAWRHATGRHRRVEHWSNAGDQARILASALLDADVRGTTQVPFFWSDQYGLKIQAFGHPSRDHTVHILEDDGRAFLACYASEGVLTAVVGAGRPREVVKLRAKVAAAAPIEDILAPS